MKQAYEQFCIGLKMLINFIFIIIIFLVIVSKHGINLENVK